MTAIRTLVVDDEPLTRERVRTLVSETEGLELVGEARNGLEALDKISTLEPDLVFIDVEMPELDGFGVISELDLKSAPAVVFVTAFEHYAVQAFEVGAIDYLHKPVTRQRFDAAVNRAKERLRTPSMADWISLVAAAAAAERSRGARRRFVVKRGDLHQFVSVDDVDWIDAADNYLRLHAGSKVHFYRGTMKQVEGELDQRQFMRIHRSAIVAINRIESIRSHDGDGHVVRLLDGIELRSSRQYDSRVSSLLR
ncbi:MAG: response regulator transcription factor [Gemmatimonadales bacterium]